QDLCVPASVERSHVMTKTATFQPFLISTHEHPTIRGLEALSEAFAIRTFGRRNLTQIGTEVTGTGRRGSHRIDDAVNFTILSDLLHERLLPTEQLGDALVDGD